MNQDTTQRTFRFLLYLAAIPIIAALLYVLVAWLQGFSRYAEVHFTPALRAKYASLGDIADIQEQVLLSGDAVLYAQATGMKEPPSPPMVSFTEVRRLRLVENEPPGYGLIRFYDANGPLNSPEYFTQVNGRWVVVPQDAYFYFDSGLWVKAWLPLALGWWMILLGVFLAMAIREMSIGWRRRLMPRPDDI